MPIYAEAPVTFDQFVQLAGLVVTGVVTRWGYISVAQRLSNYVPVDIYRAKVTELHDKNNELERKQAVQEREIEWLKSRVAFLEERSK